MSFLKQSFEPYLQAIRLRIRPRSILIAGPFAGEFGFELMAWQAYVRSLRQHYKQTRVITFPGRQYLYEDCQVVSHNLSLVSAGYAWGNMSAEEMRQYADNYAKEQGIINYDVFNTSLLKTRLNRVLIIGRRWRVFGSEFSHDRRYEIAFHFRNIVKDGPERRANFALESAERLVALCRQKNLRCVAIGHPEYAFCPPNCDDARSLEAGDAVKAIARSKFAVGQLSGPMHLAVLCAVPIITWADGQWRIDVAKSRSWNPHRSKIHVVSSTTFCPDPKNVFAHIQQKMEN
jgi:hypothetical protein